MILIGVLILIVDLAWFWYLFLFQCCIAVLLLPLLFPYYISVILLPFLISIWYCCDFATFCHLNTIYLNIIWFWCDFDIISWLKHLLNALRLSPFIRGRWVLMFEWGKARDAGGAADARQVSIQITSQSWRVQGRWRGRNMDYRRSVKITQGK